jgi:hypothetical protein
MDDLESPLHSFSLCFNTISLAVDSRFLVSVTWCLTY